MKYQEKPLAGVRVIDPTTYSAGPNVGRVLADWGADVIKVETPSGDMARVADGNTGLPKAHGTSIQWDCMNGNKRGICLDLRSEEGRGIMRRLLDTADVFLSSNRLQALKAIGLDWETLSAKYPRLIWTHISGYGQEGPLANEPGFDTICFWARSGAMIDFAEKDTAPLASASGSADFNCGPTVAGAVGAALYQREKTGKGTRLTYSLYANGIWDLTSLYLAAQAGKVSYPRSRKDNAPLNNTYRCRDGEWIIITAFDWDIHFPNICKILGHPELPADPRFKDLETAFANKRGIIDIFDGSFAQMDSDTAYARLKEQGVPATKLTHSKDVLSDEQAPVQFGGPYPPEHKPGPLLGEHTDEVLTELGFSGNAIAKLREGKVVR
jgi:crotonobetainyl-CoA:carnitine CoA-transferase CaiB-like acyl-CoA transferase